MRQRKLNCKPVVKKHLERAAKFEWSKILKDPRSSINLEWNFDYLINILFFGMLTGMINLRRVEDFSESYHERVPDTTLIFIMCKIDPEPLRLLIVREVKKAIRDHELSNKKFPIRIIAIDGKCASVSKIDVGDFSQRSECNGGVQYVNRVLRAAHVSSEPILILGQREIHGKTSETKEFIPFIKELISWYGKTGILEVISVDAGMISLDNANFLIEEMFEYIMALKNPQKKLVDLAAKLLGDRTNFDKETLAHYNGKQITRKLVRCIAPEYPGWPHLEQFWRIRQETVYKGKVTVEERYFITSIDYNILTDLEVMKAIRMHWGIENNANWICDTVWKEDDSPWCNRAFVLITLLRILAYNIISRLKSRRLRTKNDRERSWLGILLIVYSVLIEIKIDLNMEAFIHTCKE